MNARVVRAWHVLRARLAFAGHGVALGRRAELRGLRPRVDNQGSMQIGSGLLLLGDQFRSKLSTGPDGQLTIGDGVLINQGTTVHSALRVVIADGVRIADLVAIYDTDFHEVEPGLGPTTKAVHIGENAWLGRGAVVLPGVTVGAHAVVAAGSVVTTDVAPATLVGGNPAKLIRELAVDGDYRRP